MKTLILISAIALFFSGCFDHNEINKQAKEYFDANGTMVCYHMVGGGYKSTGHPEDKTIVHKNTHIIVNKNTQVVDLNLTHAPFSLFNCEPISDKDVFSLDDGDYILLNGSAKKLAN